MPEDTFRWVITGGVAIATLSILIMAIAAVVTYRVVSKLQATIDDVTERVDPIIDTVRRLADENAPKVSDIVTSAQVTAANSRDISVLAKEQAERFSEIGRDVADRARAQVARVDAAVDETVEQAHVLGHNVKVAVMKPVREASGVVAGIRAGVAAYAQGRRPDITRATQDEEMFI